MRQCIGVELVVVVPLSAPVVDGASREAGEMVDDGHVAVVQEEQAADESLFVGDVGSIEHGRPLWIGGR